MTTSETSQGNASYPYPPGLADEQPAPRMTIDAMQFAKLCNLFHLTGCEGAEPTAEQMGDVLLYGAYPMVCDHSREMARAVMAYLGIRFGDADSAVANELIDDVCTAMINGEHALMAWEDDEDDELPDGGTGVS